MAKYKGPKVPKGKKVIAGDEPRAKPAKRSVEDVDEIATFHQSKDRLALDADLDSEGGEDVLAESEDEGVFDLEAGLSDSGSDSEENEAQDKRLAACAGLPALCFSVPACLLATFA